MSESVNFRLHDGWNTYNGERGPPWGALVGYVSGTLAAQREELAEDAMVFMPKRSGLQTEDSVECLVMGGNDTPASGDKFEPSEARRMRLSKCGRVDYVGRRGRWTGRQCEFHPERAS